MSPIDLMVVGFPVAIVLLVGIGFYKVFVKKKSVELIYTPFDEIGQSEVEFQEEREILAVDEEQGDKKNKKHNHAI